MADSNLLEDTRVVTENTEPEDHDTFSHYVSKKKWGEAILTGGTVTALCGKTWHPTKDEKRFSICPTCKEEWEKLRGE